MAAHKTILTVVVTGNPTTLARHSDLPSTPDVIAKTARRADAAVALAVTLPIHPPD